MAVVLHECADHAGALVAEHVGPEERDVRAAAVHEAADDRAVAARVGPLEDRVARAGGTGAAVIGVFALAQVPTPIDAAPAGARVVDLLEVALAAVTAPDVVRLAVERDS